jgi:hypothetical protein
MPVHDWTQVEAGIFHDFNTVWVGQIHNILNEGLLPEGYYALAKQHAGKTIPDILTLHASTPPQPSVPSSELPAAGGTAVAQAPPRVRHRETLEGTLLARRRSLAIRHVSGHRLVALLEIISPANKDRAATVNDFTAKAADALDSGIHLLVVDLFPPGSFDPQGIHGAIRQRLYQFEEPYSLPADEPLTMASYAAGRDVEVYLEHFSVGAALPDMPLFLKSDRYVNVPLESAYAEAYRGTPAFWRDVLERR